MMRKEPAWFEVGLTNCDSLSFVPRLCGSAATPTFCISAAGPRAGNLQRKDGMRSQRKQGKWRFKQNLHTILTDESNTIHSYHPYIPISQQCRASPGQRRHWLRRAFSTLPGSHGCKVLRCSSCQHEP